MKKHFDESKHPRGKRGTPDGGKFVKKSGSENLVKSTVTNRPYNAYHITLKDNSESIKSNGLKPASEVGKSQLLLGSEIEYDIDGVFVANASQAISLFSQLSEDADVAIFEVYIPKGTTIFEDRLMPEGSFIVPGNISKNHVREITVDVLKKRKDEFSSIF